MKTLFVILTIVLLTGCVSTSSSIITEDFVRNHPEYNWERIHQRQVVVGMTKDEVLLSWGEPRDINRASYGDQWVYGSSIRSIQHRGNRYLHFDTNGVLTSWN